MDHSPITHPNRRRRWRRSRARSLPVLAAALAAAGALASPASAGGLGDQPAPPDLNVTVLPVSVESGEMTLAGRPFDQHGSVDDTRLERMLEAAKAENETKAAPGAAPGSSAGSSGMQAPGTVLGLLSAKCGPDGTAATTRPRSRIYPADGGGGQSADELMGEEMTDDEFDALVKDLITENPGREDLGGTERSDSMAAKVMVRGSRELVVVYPTGGTMTLLLWEPYPGPDHVHIEWFEGLGAELMEWRDKPSSGGEISPEEGESALPEATPCDRSGQRHWLIRVHGASATGDPCNEEVADPSPAAEVGDAPPPPPAELDCGDETDRGTPPDPTAPPDSGGCDPTVNPCDEEPSGPAPTGDGVSPAALAWAQTVLADLMCPPIVCNKAGGRLDADSDYGLFRFVLL